MFAVGKDNDAAETLDRVNEEIDYIQSTAEAYFSA
jgi:hypothetical protein